MSNAPAITNRSFDRRSSKPVEPTSRPAQLPEMPAPANDSEDVSGAKSAADARDARALARVGTKLGGWRLSRLLGVGPVSTAYEAYLGDDDAGEHVVLRLLSGAHDEPARLLFLRAAYAANRFRHPRIVTVTQDGTSEDGDPFVVRPWHDVKPLSEVLASTDMGERDVMRLAEQVLDALEMAHAHGITHGAVTLSNILLTPRGSVRLCDFAVRPGAVTSGIDPEDCLATLRAGPHTAPERCSSPAAAVTEQSDIWSVAACLYYALTKQWPRGDAKSREELAVQPVKAIREAAPEASQVSEAFATILDYALAFEPAKRYDSAYAMLGDIRRAMAGRAPKLSAAKRPVPSGSYRGLSPSMITPLSGPHHTTLSGSRPSLTTARRRRRSQWRGNMALMAAIMTLVGLATYVMIREKMADQHRLHQHGPTSQPR